MTGRLIIIFSLLVIMFGVFIIVISEHGFNEKLKQNDVIMERYYQDTARINAQVKELEQQQMQALAEGDSLIASMLEDSICVVTELPPLAVQGFNIGGAFGMFFVMVAVPILIVGIVLLIVARYKKRKAMQGFPPKQ